MNRHFGDAWYYLRRAAESASTGLRVELRPVVRAVRRRLGDEPEPETRVEAVKARLANVEESATTEGRRLVASARGRVGRSGTE